MARSLSYALHIRNRQFHGEKTISSEPEKEAYVEEGHGRVPEAGCPQLEAVLLPVVSSARFDHLSDVQLIATGAL